MPYCRHRNGLKAHLGLAPMGAALPKGTWQCVGYRYRNLRQVISAAYGRTWKEAHHNWKEMK